MEKSVVCFGEVLWDVFPDEKIPGGAPMNVAYHLKNLGVQSYVVSRIGNDQLGDELLKFLKNKGVNTEYIQLDETFPTGIVNVALDSKGHAEYEIMQPVAWDYIRIEDGVLDLAKEVDILVFGSLACRNRISKNSLLELLKVARQKVFDVNLRKPFYTRDLLEELIRQTDYVKMNDEELDVIAGWYKNLTDEKEKLELVRNTFELKGIILTKGKHGAVFFDQNGLYDQGGFPINVADTVGSGDSFLAAFLMKLLSGASPKESLRFASATGALVATKKGGTPLITESDVEKFMSEVS